MVLLWLDSLQRSYSTLCMALRVLLADESSTIKKVMQLALQDYSVEVKSVPVGIDVLPVTKIFKPDIIFADVLLTKKTGYEVCDDLKNDPETQHIPVVLMWSGFIDFDVTKAADSRANRSLEKPFDADLLRRLVQDLVPKTLENPLSQYLDFPSMPDLKEKPILQTETVHTTPQVTSLNLQETSLKPQPTHLNLDEIPLGSPEGFTSFKGLEYNPLEEPKENIASDDFHQVPLTNQKPINSNNDDFFSEKLLSAPFPSEEKEEEEWAQKELKGISIPASPKNEEPSPAVSPTLSSEFSKAHVNIQGDFAEVSFDNSIHNSMASILSSASEKMSPQLSKEQAEKIIRDEARKVIETVCWHILPDITERLVKNEIEKLMKETEGLPSSHPL